MVHARVGDTGVVHIEQAVVAVLAIVAANVYHRVARVEVPVIAGGPERENIGTAQAVPPGRRLSSRGQDFEFLTQRAGAAAPSLCTPSPVRGVLGGGSRGSRPRR